MSRSRQPIGPMKKGNVVMTLTIEGGKVYICDDYCRDMTEEDVQKVLQRTADEILPYLQAQHERQLKEQQTKEKPA